MKNKEFKEIATALIRDSADFKVNNVDYEFEGNNLRIWSSTNEFHSVSLVVTFTCSLFNMYMDYNPTEERVEMVVFWVAL